MKKLTIIFAGLFLLFTTSAFTTTDVNVSSRIKSSFEKDFASISDATWSTKEDMYIALFKTEDKSMAAAYNDNGKLLSVSREINLSMLPIGVSLALKNKYADYNISNSVIELFSENTSYFIDAENAKHKIRLQSDSSGNLTVVSKTKKK